MRDECCTTVTKITEIIWAWFFWFFLFQFSVIIWFGVENLYLQMMRAEKWWTHGHTKPNIISLSLYNYLDVGDVACAIQIGCMACVMISDIHHSSPSSLHFRRVPQTCKQLLSKETGIFVTFQREQRLSDNRHESSKADCEVVDKRFRNELPRS